MTACVVQACPGELERLYRLKAFDVCRCSRCGMMVRQPFPNDAELRAMYEDPGYHESPYFASQFERLPGRESPERAIYREALDWLEQRFAETGAPRTLLDVGCGSGLFLCLARERGWQGEGIEYSHRLAQRARDEQGLDVHEGDFLQVRPSRDRYTVVTMWDVLEHVREPDRVLEAARLLLRPDGVLVVFTIDCSSLFNLAGAALYHLSVGRMTRPLELLYDARHNFYFTRATLRACLERAGFRIAATQHHRAHLARWLSEPAPFWLHLGGDVLDLVSLLVRRQYRQLVYCVPRVAASGPASLRAAF